MKNGYKTIINAKWSFQKVRQGQSINYELRIYTISPIKTSRELAIELAEKLKNLGYGACVRSKDTFVTIRKGKEELAVILHELGILKELIPNNAPEKVKENIEKELRKIEQGYTICEIPEEELFNFYKQLIEYVNNEFQELTQKYGNEEKAIEELKKEFTNLYIKLPLTINEIRNRIRENEDYVTWLTICDGITSIIVDHNVNTLEYGTTRHELLAIVTKALGFAKLRITGKDPKSGRIRVVATCNNYIAHEILKQQIPEIDQIIGKVRQIITQSGKLLRKFILENFNVDIPDRHEIEEFLRNIILKDTSVLQKLLDYADRFSNLLKELVRDPIKAFAGAMEGDGVAEKSKEYYLFGISSAIYSVKGFAILQLLNLLKKLDLIEINCVKLKSYKISIWLRPNIREKLSNLIEHPTRKERLKESSRKILVNAIGFDINRAIKVFNELINFCNLTNTKIEASWCIEYRKDGRELQLLIKVLSSNMKTIDAANKLVEILRNHGIRANQIPKSAIVRVRRGKIELAYLLYKHGFFKGEFVPKEIGGEIERILKSIIDKLEETRL